MKKTTDKFVKKEDDMYMANYLLYTVALLLTIPVITLLLLLWFGKI